MASDSLEYELAVRAKAGDRDALEELVERTRMRLFALAYAELRHYDDAQDAVASALVRVCQHISRLKDPGRAREWMNAIVRNEARRLRHRQGPPTFSLQEEDQTQPGMQTTLLRLDVERALHRLPGEQALALRLFYLADLSIPEIARRLDRPEGTIKSWLHRGRQHLAYQMEDYAPMTKTPAPPAALIQTSLDPRLMAHITDSLRTAGFDPTILSPADNSCPPDLSEYGLILVDEQVGSRSGLELLIHVLTDVDTQNIPVCLLTSDPWDSTVYVCANIGADAVINKQSEDWKGELPGLFSWFRTQGKRSSRKEPWRRFTDRAKGLLLAAQDLANSRRQWMAPEHLLLILVQARHSVGAQLLARLGVQLERLEAELEEALIGAASSGSASGIDQASRQVLDSAHEEARRSTTNYLGTEHLLLGILSVGTCKASQILHRSGIDLESARQALDRSLLPDRPDLSDRPHA